MKIIDSHNYEEWIFEYYEGTLHPDDKELLMDFIQKDPEYLQEFKHWGNSYLREPLPPKLTFEKDLLQSTRSIAPKYYYGTGLLVAVIIFWIGVESKKDNKVNRSSITSTIKHVQKNLEEPKRESLVIIAVRKKPVPSNSTKVDTIVHSSEVNQMTIQPSTLIENKVRDIKKDTIITVIPFVVKPELGEEQKSKEQRKLERQKLRKIERFKEQQKHKRAAQKLMEGDLPYVVPIDPNTF